MCSVELRLDLGKHLMARNRFKFCSKTQKRGNKFRGARSEHLIRVEVSARSTKKPGPTIQQKLCLLELRNNFD